MSAKNESENLEEEIEDATRKGKTIHVKHTFEKRGDKIAVDELKNWSERIPDEALSERGRKIKKALKNEDPEKEDLKIRLAVRESQLGTIALNEFKSEKKKLLKSIPEDRREKLNELIGSDPEKLESLRIQQIASGRVKPEYNWDLNPEDLGHVPPKGKVGLPDAGERQFKSATAYIDRLYEILENPNSTPAELKVANAKVDSFFENVIRGRRASGHTDYSFGSIMCPKCGKMILSSDRKKEIRSCPYCSWVKYREQRA